MSSENQAHYARIGFFIVAGLALIAGTLVHLGGVGSERDLFFAETYFADSISGLDVGSAVNFRGVRVGAVRRISFVRVEYDVASMDDARKIYVEMAIDARLFRVNHERRPAEVLERMVEKGLHATVSASGVTGLSRIELDFPKTAVRDDRRPAWRPAHVFVPPAPSILQSAADSAQQILGQLNRMDFVAAYSNLMSVASGADEALRSFNAVLTGEQGNIAEILSNVRDASASLREFADRIRDNPSSILRNYTPEPLDETKGAN